MTFAQLSITGPSTISQNWPYVTFSNYCTSGDTAAYNIWTLPSSSGGYFNFAYGNGNPQAIAAQTKINVEPANNCVSWGDNATWWPFYDIPATISVTNGGMSATKTILMTPNTYGQTVQPLSTITKTACASDSIIVGTVTAYSNYYALQRTGPKAPHQSSQKYLTKFTKVLLENSRSTGTGTSPKDNPYSDNFLGLCGHILLQIQCFCFVFRNKVPQTLSCVVLR